MTKVITVTLLGAFVLRAELPAQKNEFEMQPYQATALASALQSPKAGSGQFPANLKWLTLKPAPSPHLLAKANGPSSSIDCVIPLIEERADRNVDKRMQVPMKRDGFALDAMPKLKALPACRDNH
jgi:hypothetical protein